ncbi:hypothetical protein EW146_g6464 [Bondarzewia mesenterica]|uniref:Zn-dependent exopeptidase n=1 Tax=Bondarzewia mesenterica TaxID=1095465 RepID=A0A4V3XEJ6_9AGAM|nr:hypothetical protein EW146_g6464 [Bondarzewia mesenterica]
MGDDNFVTQPLLGVQEKATQDDVLVPPVTQQAPKHRSRVVKLIKRSILFVFLWIVIHRLLFYLAYPSFHHHLEAKGTQGCAKKDSTWAMKAFKPSVPFGHIAEELFLTVPNSASAISASRQYATKPHLAGSEGDFATAVDFLELLQRELAVAIPDSKPIFPAGSDASRNATLSITNITEPSAWIDIYYPVMNTAVNHSLQILSDDGEVAWAADLEEVSDGTDPEAGKYVNAVSTWHGLSRGGDVQGKLIYANYGLKEDFDDLVNKGVNFTGSIVIVRYGGLFRGLKVKGAQELGAAGVLVYSDPRDDGTVTVENGYKPYPYGPARSPTSVQRGSVQFLSIYPGDPTTPGYPAYENSTRTDGSNIPSIPSLPISWANAKVLLEEIADDREGRMVRLINNVDDKVTPIWNTMGVIPGHIKDEVVVVGNHRDAWVMGAADPSSGTASIHEVVRGLGVLLKAGWTPLRTIVIASWDAEEVFLLVFDTKREILTSHLQYGLIGSTEWGEDFPEFIDKHVVAYLNLDVSVSGSHYGARASPSLAHVVRSTAEKIPHPTDPGRTLWDARHDRGPLYGEIVDPQVVAMAEEAANAVDSVGVGAVGSGSDFTVFLQRLGVASMDHGFGSSLSDPVYHYHSVFDSERWQELYGDPGFVKHVAVAKHFGLLTLRLADTIILPINTTHYAFELESYLDKVEELATASSVLTDLAPLRAAITSLQRASIKLDHEKWVAEAHLRHLLKHIMHRHGHKKGLRQVIGKACHKLKKVFGKGDEEVKELTTPMHVPELEIMITKDGHRRLVKPRIGRLPGWIKEQEEKKMKELEKEATFEIADNDEDGPHPPHLPHLPRPPKPHWPPHHKHKGPSRRFKRAVQHVQKVNQKLATFERGFIHEDGIKDREWYRHLGVAPGKWLGYGATTLPALTESITIEKKRDARSV